MVTKGRQEWIDRALAFAGAIYPYSLVSLVLRRGRLPRARRADWPWLGSVCAYLILSVVHESLDPNVLGVVVAWLVFRSAAQFGGASALKRPMGTGFAIGVIGIAAFTVVEVLVLGRPRAEGFPWFGHPNLLGHVLLVVGIGITATTTSGKLRWLTLCAASVALLLAGSRSTFVGLLTILAFGFFGWKHLRVPITITVGALVSVLTAVTLLAPGSPWAQRVLGPFIGDTVDTSRINLIVASEALANPAAWSPGGVEVRTTRSGDSRVPVVHSMHRTVEAVWARPQQLITLEPHQPYTFSGEFMASGRSEPGYLAWAATSSGIVELRVAIRSEAAIIHTARGFDSTAARVSTLDDGWKRLEVTTRLDGEGAVALAFGPSPDLASATAGAVAQVRAIQVETGPTASRYRPTTRIRTGTGEAMSRVPIWLAALEGVRERPLTGWGQATFPAYFTERAPEPGGRDVPAHPHNQVLASAFDGGTIGVVAIGLLVWALARSSVGWSRAVLVALLVANLFDATLLAGIILLPVAFLCGLDVHVSPERSREQRI